MNTAQLKQISESQWQIPTQGKMQVPGIIYATRDLIEDMDDKVGEQVRNVASLPGIVRASYAMPDAHWGYGFPIGGVAAFDPDKGGVVSAGGVGFDISCGVRNLHTGLSGQDIRSRQEDLADILFRQIPAGVGSIGKIHLRLDEMDEMLEGGASWAVKQGYGEPQDLGRIEEAGRMKGADPSQVSARAKKRQQDEMGTLGSGNHYLEVQVVEEIFDSEVAGVFGIREQDAIISIHCGSRGLGHQIGTEFLKDMVSAAPRFGIQLPDRELACAPLRSPMGESYLGAMRSGINCALANRQILTHLARESFSRIFPNHSLDVLYDVSHNTCKLETHRLEGKDRNLFIHRKGATRAWGPGHPDLPSVFREVGQPVLIGGTMGTASFILVGTSGGEELSFGSSCHGAGRAMSRNQARKRWNGKQIVDHLASKGITIRSPSFRGVAEEAPNAYKDISHVVAAAEAAGISRRVARVEPIICIKG